MTSNYANISNFTATQNVADQIAGTVLSLAGVDSAANGANVLVPTFANGTAAQLSDTGRDYEVYLAVTTGGTACTLKIGPTSAVAYTIMPSSSWTAGQQLNVHLPAGWFLEWAGTSAAIATQTAISC